MKLSSKLITSALVSATALAMATIGFVGSASAACIQYNANGFNTPTTPVFNNICGVPNVGNESDFVRIRQSSNGDDKDNQNNPNYTGTTVTSLCNAGDKFDIWNYVHNDATQDSNNNGSGTAVAHDVAINMVAHLNTPGSAFRFTSTVSASNADSVSDTANLDCGNKVVKLTLSPSSVHVYSQQYGWHDLNDSAVNGTTPLGSPVVGSGNQWGCWDYRVLVVYQVTVQEIPHETPQSLVCSLLNVTDLDNKNRKLHAKVTGTTQGGATITGYKLEWGDNTSDNVQEKDHTYAEVNKEYTITGTVSGIVNGQAVSSSTGCVQKVKFTAQEEKCTVKGKENLPKNSPECKETVTTLVNTGPADTLGIFAGVSVIGAVLHRMRTMRKLGQ